MKEHRMHDAGKYIEFPIPEGLDLAGIEEGEEKEVVAVIRKKGEDAACLISVDGVEIGSGDQEVSEEYPTEAEDDYARYEARARQSLL